MTDETLAIDEAIADYLESVERGEPANQQEFLKQHPELEAELKSFFADYKRIESALAGGANTPREMDASTRPVALNATSALHPDASFGDYELLEEIARGGMGVVFKARQKSLDRIVALKMILSGQLASQDEVDRFLIEARAAGSLDHPGIVPVYDVGSESGHYFYAMAFVDGNSLAAEISEGPLSQHRAVEIVIAVAEAIQFAHDRGIIHRDLKPGNILLDENEMPKVTDFGLARRQDENAGLTATGQILGTPAYMAPEQASQNSDSLTKSVDVYSLGAILYCLVTGNAPFRAATPVEVIRNVLERDPVSPRELNPQIDRDIETICLRCLEKDRSRRFANASDLADELRRWQQHKPIQSRAIGKFEQFRRWSRRNPILLAASSVVTVTLIAATIVSTLAAIRAKQKAESLTQVIEFLSDVELVRVSGNEALKKLVDRKLEAMESDDPLVICTTLNACGKLYFEVGEHTKAADTFRRSFEEATAAVGETNELAATALDQLGKCLLRKGKPEDLEEAERVLKAACAIWDKLVGRDHEASIHSYAKLGDVLNSMGNNEASMKITADVLERRRRLFGDSDRSVPVTLNSLGLINRGLAFGKQEGSQKQQHYLDEAERYLSEAVELSETHFGTDDDYTQTYHRNLALVEMQMNRFEDAKLRLEACLKTAEQKKGPRDFEALQSRYLLAICQRNCNQLQSAFQNIEFCLANVDVYGDDLFFEGAFLEERGECLFVKGENNEARECAVKARDILSDVMGAEHRLSVRATDLINRIDSQALPTFSNQPEVTGQ